MAASSSSSALAAATSRSPSSFQATPPSDAPKTIDTDVPKASVVEPTLKAKPDLVKEKVISFNTLGLGNCFFHATFGETNNLGYYEAKNASAMREEWHNFLSEFKELGNMPPALRAQMEKILIHFKNNPDALTGQEAKIKALAKKATDDLDQVYGDVDKKIDGNINILKNIIFTKYSSDATFQGKIYQIIHDAHIRQNETPPEPDQLLDKKKFNNAINLNLASCAKILEPPISEAEFKEKYTGDAILEKFYKAAYPIYLLAIKESAYYIFIEEVPIIASLADIDHIAVYLADGTKRDFPLNLSFLPAGYVRKGEVWGTKKPIEKISHKGNHYERAILMPMLPVAPAAAMLIPTDRKSREEGLKTSTHGDKYQVDLLFLAAHRASRKGEKFTLISEDGEFEKFDDLVIEYKDRITFLQVKHAKDAKETYTVTELCANQNDAENDVSLAKYYDSWSKLKKYRSKPARFIFFSNRQLEKEILDCLEPIELKDDEFLFSKLNSLSYRFKRGNLLEKKLESAILSHSTELPKEKVSLNLDINIEDLVKKLVEFLVDGIRKNSTVLKLARKKFNHLFLGILDFKGLTKEAFKAGLEEKENTANPNAATKLTFKLKDTFINNTSLTGIVKNIRDQLEAKVTGDRELHRKKSVLNKIQFICPKSLFDLTTPPPSKDDVKSTFDADKKNVSQVLWKLESKNDQLALLSLFNTDKLALTLESDQHESVVHRGLYEKLLARFDKHLIANRLKVKKLLESKATLPKDKELIATMQLLEKSYASTNIQNFFSQFIWKVSQPESHDIDAIIKEELALSKHIGSEELRHKLYKHIFDWFADPKVTMLAGDSFNDYVEHSQADLDRFYLLGKTTEFKNQYKTQPLHAELKAILHSPSLETFLAEEKKPMSYVAILHGEQNTAQKLMVYQAVEKRDYPAGDWAFLDTASPFLSQLERILIKGSELKLTIIEISPQFNTPGIISSICRSAATNRKKIILIIPVLTLDDNLIIKELQKNFFDDKLSGKKFLSIQSRHLTHPHLLTICEDKKNNYIDVGGKQRKIIDILNDPTNGIYKMMQYPEYLQEILSKAKPKESRTLLDLPYGVYEKNSIIAYMPYYDLKAILEQVPAKIFIIHDAPPEFIQSIKALLKHDDREHPKIILGMAESEAAKEVNFRIVNTAINAQELRALLEKQQKIILYGAAITGIPLDKPNSLHVKIIDKESLTAIVKTSSYTSNLPRPIDYFDPPESAEEKSSITRLALLTQSKVQSINLFAADAGKGKSALFKYLQDRWQRTEDKNFYHWLFRLSLPKLVLENYNQSEPFALERLLLASINEISPPEWMLKALQQDIKDGKVKLLLDAWDEVKGSKQQPIINFINNFPHSISYDISTRPYAKSGLTLARHPNNCFTLKPFDDVKIKKYMKRFFEKAAAISASEFTILGEPIFNLWTKGISESISKFIGIPLQAYLLCECLLPSVKAWKKDTAKDFSLLIAEDSILTPAKLYQRFTLIKLRKFLKKQLGITNTTLTESHRIYALAHVYGDLVTASAYQQIFGKPIDFVDRYLRGTYYTAESVNELEKTGIITRLPQVKSGDKYEFIHATYADYFAALFMLKNLLTDKESRLYKEIIIDIRQNRYLSRYKNIFAFAVQLAITGDPLIPSLGLYREEIIIELWLALTQPPQDIIGQGQARFISHCMGELTLAQKEVLYRCLPKELLCIVKGDVLVDVVVDDAKEGKKNIKDKSKKFIFKVAEVKVKTVESKRLTDREIAPQIQFKNTVYDFVTKLITDDPAYTKMIASLLLAATKEKQMIGSVAMDSLNRYWDIDGGFNAMAVLGNDFTMEHAYYFIEKIMQDPSWRVGPAANASLVLLNHSLEGEAFHAFMQIFVVLCDQEEQPSFNINTFISQVSQSISPELLIEKLIELFTMRLNGYQFVLINYTALETSTNFSNIIRIIFLIAHKYHYAVTFKESTGELLIFGSDYCYSLLLDDSYQDKFKEFIRENFKEYVPTKIINPFLKQFKHPLQLMNKKELFLKIPLKDQCIFVKRCIALEEYNKLFSYLHENNLIKNEFTKILAEFLTQMVRVTERYDSWPRNQGIQAIGYTGSHFNESLANFLAIRADWWLDNKYKAINTLQLIYKDLIKLINANGIDADISHAIEAYNMCIENDVFKESELNVIDTKNFIKDRPQHSQEKKEEEKKEEKKTDKLTDPCDETEDEVVSSASISYSSEKDANNKRKREDNQQGNKKHKGASSSLRDNSLFPSTEVKRPDVKKSTTASASEYSLSLSPTPE